MSPELEPDLLRTFATIADAGSFTRAARAVHRTQSAVSMQMRRLEARVGRPLFERDGRRLRLTPDGEALLGYARRILRLHAEALAVLGRPALEGMVRVGTPDDYVMHFLPGILAQFAREHPQVEVAVRCEPSGNLLQALQREELDLALITCDPGGEGGELLRQEPTVWATSERHLVHEEDPLPLAVFQQGCWFRDWALKALHDCGRHYRIAFTSPSVSAVQAAISAGIAVGVLGAGTLPPGTRALALEEGFPGLPAVTVALHRAPGPRTEAVESFAARVVELLRSDEAGLR